MLLMPVDTGARVVPEKKDSHITSYRTCFSTDAGRRVLGDLLIQAGYFDTDLKTAEELAVLNFVKNIIKNMGVAGHPKDVSMFVDKLVQIGW